jgi:predicted permease
MGAGTGGLVRQLLTESLLVGLAGGALGVALAQAGLASLIALSPEALPRQDAVTLDLRVLVFAAALSAATALVFGLLPALRSVGGDLTGELHGSGRSTTAGRGVQGLRRLLVAGEVALSLVLVAGAGLLLRSFMRVQAQDPGFEAPRVWTLPLTPTGIDDPAEWVLAMGGIRDALAAAPGVEEATYALTTPLEFAGGGRCCWRTGITVEGREDAQPTAIHPVSAEYFETLGIGLRAGRSWAAADARAEPTPVVVSEAFAVALYGAADAAVGRPLAFGDFQATVVGVAGDVRHYGLDTDADPALYLPIERLPFAIPKVTMAVRLRADASAGLGRALREAVWSAAPDMPVPILRSMDEWQERGTAGRRFESVLTGMFAMLALLLAAGGLYGTLLYLAGQRRRELGIRLALGASRARIERQVLVGGLVMAGLGVGIGLAGAWASGRLLQSRLWGIEAGDPLTLSVSAALLLATALLASWVPARRAGRTDPLETLRVE